ncbi:MAG: ribosome rescue GTPase HflX, partial [Gammaproteobacteria bacterium]
NSDLEESLELVRATGATIVEVVRAPLTGVDAKHFVGSGKVDEIIAAAHQYCADTIIFDQPLAPGQERNLQRSLNLPVVDRIGLILDIFAQRARSYEGKLQVELAQLRHLSTRLVRGWTHLERQKGGIGLRGPGESQLETDRRLVRDRIALLRRRLSRVHRQRGQNRARRARSELPTISLAGYTNSGKSTLFNRLTGDQVFSADQLFATLDPTMRKVEWPGCEPLVLADTVGFVRDLPHDLIDAFQSTLEEVSGAQLILHVVDSAREDLHELRQEVNQVLAQIGASEVPQLLIKNKIDLLDRSPSIERDDEGKLRTVWLSALTGEGIDLLQQAITELLTQNWQCYQLELPSVDGAVRAAIHRLGRLLGERFDEQGGWRVQFEMAPADYQRLLGGHRG